MIMKWYRLGYPGNSKAMENARDYNSWDCSHGAKTHKVGTSKVTSHLAIPPTTACRGPVGVQATADNAPGAWPRTGEGSFGSAETQLVLLAISFIPEIARPSLGLQGAQRSCCVLILPSSYLRERAIPEPLWAGMRITHLIPPTY